VSAFLPYGRQAIDDQDVDALASALREELITQGPRVATFERAFADVCGARHAIAFASGTAALHAAAVACGIGPGDDVLTTPISFVASSNCVLYAGGRPLFADIDPDTLNLNIAGAVASHKLDHVKGVVAVSLAGLPADLMPLQPLRDRGLRVIEDACHALGARRGGRPVGGDGLADASVFSLHPVKAITTGEGGVVTTEDDTLAQRLKMFRAHGITRGEAGDLDPLHGPWHYDVSSLGFNYRITDFQCALGSSQLRKLDRFIAQRNQIATRYRELLADVNGLLLPPAAGEDCLHGYHLFVVRLTEGAWRRRAVFERLREAGIGTQLHYIPIYRHTLYRSLGYGAEEDRLPEAERYYASALSLPIFPAMTDSDVARVAGELRCLLGEPLTELAS
jgi:UDP-4-amino-4,6-dideoxy-N-acetyl-beta-L-altrosamine transaminase